MRFELRVSEMKSLPFDPQPLPLGILFAANFCPFLWDRDLIWSELLDVNFSPRINFSSRLWRALPRASSASASPSHFRFRIRRRRYLRKGPDRRPATTTPRSGRRWATWRPTSTSASASTSASTRAPTWARRKKFLSMRFLLRFQPGSWLFDYSLGPRI